MLKSSKLTVTEDRVLGITVEKVIIWLGAFYFDNHIVAMRTNLIPSNSLKTLVETVGDHSLKHSLETHKIKNVQTEHTQIFCNQRVW